MTHEDRGHYSKKHPPGRTPRPEVVAAVQERAPGGEISCVAAHEIARALEVPPEEVGFTLDRLELRIIRCQLGLFGYTPLKRTVRPADHVPQDLERAIRDSLERGRLSCKNAWDLAADFGMAKMAVSSACEALGIKITSCQLGAFKRSEES